MKWLKPESQKSQTNLIVLYVQNSLYLRLRISLFDEVVSSCCEVKQQVV